MAHEHPRLPSQLPTPSGTTREDLHILRSPNPSRHPSNPQPSVVYPPPSNQQRHHRRETWVDFLQNSSQPDTPIDPRDRYLADRKRRLTTAESPLRRPSQPSRSSVNMEASSSSTAPAGQRVLTHPSSLPGSTILNAIDLTGPEEGPGQSVSWANLELPSHGAGDGSRLGRRQNEVSIPKWQPDAEISYCPVCGNQFNFWYRKHHCRKCGRVVCANCSPHRITIPRQFIVHPPSLAGESQPDIDDALNDDSSAYDSHNMWGGEEVRVCNPCVPDPNLNPPPFNASPSRGWRFPEHHDGPSRPPPGSMPFPTAPDASRLGHRSTQSDTHLLNPTRYAQSPFSNTNLTFQNPSSVRDLWPPTGIPHPALYPPRTSSAAVPGTNFGHRNISFFPTSSSSSPMSQALAPPERPEIAEEDECPICASELPPKGLNGDTTARESHVEDCIRGHMYSATSTSAPSRTGIAVPSSLLGNSTLPVLPGTSSASPRSIVSGPRPRRMTGGRMLVYLATEKDCTGEDGSANECVICLEEFENGDEMGRLECLCKFHRKCIRDWWETKGAGTCPTHQLHE